MTKTFEKQTNDFLKRLRKSCEIKRNRLNTPELRRKLGSMLTDIGENFHYLNLVHCYKE